MTPKPIPHNHYSCDHYSHNQDSHDRGQAQTELDGKTISNQYYELRADFKRLIVIYKLIEEELWRHRCEGGWDGRDGCFSILRNRHDIVRWLMQTSNGQGAPSCYQTLQVGFLKLDQNYEIFQRQRLCHECDLVPGTNGMLAGMPWDAYGKGRG
jgi:hypothetical protein